jgi:hypothetical protein
MRHFILPLAIGIGLPAFALAASPTYTVVDLGTSPGLAWAPVPPTVTRNSAPQIGSLGGGVSYIYQVRGNAAVGVSNVANPDCRGGDVFHAFLFSFVTQKMLDLGAFNSRCASAALSLNASNVVVGWAQKEIGSIAVDANGGAQTPFVWRNGTMQELPILLQPNTEEQDRQRFGSANGINNAGEIVGETAQALTTGDVAARAVVWENGAAAKPLELQFQLGKLSHTYAFTNASAINCQGNIAVTGYPLSRGSADVHAYLLVRQGAQRSCPE